MNRIIRPGRTKPDPGPQINELTKLWLEAFQLCVNQKDYALARTMFSPSVIAFGTVAHAAIGIDELVSEQWRKRWPKNESFAFDIDQAKMILAPPYVICVLTWSGTDIDGSERKGRATIVLIAKKGEDEPVELRCCHSHLSTLMRSELRPNDPSSPTCADQDIERNQTKGKTDER